MPIKVVLLADNNRPFLDTLAARLEAAGYRVIKACSPREAREMLEHNWFHVAIVDIRLEDDEDEYDLSGLQLARDPQYKLIPKIVLTTHARYEYATEAMRPSREGLPPAVDFSAKSEGVDKLLEALERVFNEHVQIKWNLELSWEGTDSFSLANQLQPELKDDHIQVINRAEELKDLFRKLFSYGKQVRVGRILWQREGRIAVAVTTFREDEQVESSLVVCSKFEFGKDEARAYADFAPRTPGEGSAVAINHTNTFHFAACAYSLNGEDPAGLQTLAEFYRSSSERSFSNVLTTLFQKNLAAWHQDRQVSKATTGLENLYMERLSLSPLHFTLEAFSIHLQALAEKLAVLGLEIKYSNTQFSFQFGKRSYSYPDPTSMLYEKKFSNPSQSLLLVCGPGFLSGENILTDGQERIWLTDFGEAGLVPLLWNFCALEAVMRFEWLESSQFQQLHDAELRLLDLGGFNKQDTQSMDIVLGKAMKSILRIRQLAGTYLEKYQKDYQIGMLFFAARYLAYSRPPAQLTRRELTRLGHILMAAAMLAGSVSSDLSGSKKGYGRLTLDEVGRAALLDGKRINLTNTEFELLQELYNQAGQVCRRADLYWRLFKSEYTGSSDQNSTLNTYMGRLRQKVEPDPEHPHYLLTLQGVGYRLILEPSSI